MKSFLGMLLVAGVFALSLAAFQDEARAEEMVSSWYGPGFEGATTASGEVFNPYFEYTAAEEIGLAAVGADVADVEVLDQRPSWDAYGWKFCGSGV
jgi:hypothetical protein